MLRLGGEPAPHLAPVRQHNIMTLIAEIHRKLDSQGWCIVERDDSILDFACQFGKPISTRQDGALIDRLHVVGSNEAYPNSLSSRFGTGAFPFHTDGAHHRIVPRYLLLRLHWPEFSDRATLLLDLISEINKKEYEVLNSDIWKVTNGNRYFLSPVISSLGLRYDPVAMKLATPRISKSKEIIHRIIEEVTPVSVTWHKGFILLVDNHRMIHSRAPSRAGHKDKRVLERVLVI